MELAFAHSTSVYRFALALAPACVSANIQKGAVASAHLYSLVETAKANGLEPHAYLTEVYERLPLATTVEDVEALLPWNLPPEK